MDKFSKPQRNSFPRISRMSPAVSNSKGCSTQVSRPRICPSWLISPEPDQFKRATLNGIHHSLDLGTIGRDAEIDLKLTTLLEVEFVPTHFSENLDLDKEDRGMHQ